MPTNITVKHTKFDKNRKNSFFIYHKTCDFYFTWNTFPYVPGIVLMISGTKTTATQFF